MGGGEGKGFSISNGINIRPRLYGENLSRVEGSLASSLPA